MMKDMTSVLLTNAKERMDARSPPGGNPEFEV